MNQGTAEIWDVAVIGGGAAGLFAALTAAEQGSRVLILEKNRRPGVKILMSGGTRCNLTNARGLRRLDAVTGPIDPEFPVDRLQGIRSIQEAFSSAAGRFLGPSLKAFDVDATVRWFESHGVATKVEANGKIFPCSDRASDVLEALESAVRAAGAKLWTLTPVQAIELAEAEGLFVVSTPKGPVHAKRIILATGGRSFPGCGTTGDGYGMAAKFGHTIVETRPALVPIVVEADWVRDCKGITLTDVGVKVVDPEGRVADSRRESLLFAHFGLTGPAILDVSRPLARAGSTRGWTIRIDLIPDHSAEAFESQLVESSRKGRVGISRLLPDRIPNRIKELVLSQCGLASGAIAAEMPREKRKALVAAVKSLAMPVATTLGFEKAEVTSGGVSLEEVDPKTLESRLRPGLHLIGEVLDIDGRIGGYNFQAAWSMGRLAGRVAAELTKGSSERASSGTIEV
ncbi:aminoacetone oxidase family FAD-binding enzyme [bacterium]|nr:aminoacetone oxidase family FAD-binding enzyme [bacterium]